uniref:Uncharacterized protein n=1 Tax=Pseudictyota dubia TaxID=2749911 RepID=A0A7R9WC18_9STRA|mmetsp:Transcript_41602/g.76895  ORF Transcript_41602/g.76895 Transcript_41602/m.76895 type:complete len:194 (+) Transcript_41602:165-746(+)
MVAPLRRVGQHPTSLIKKIGQRRGIIVIIYCQTPSLSELTQFQPDQKCPPEPNFSSNLTLIRNVVVAAMGIRGRKKKRWRRIPPIIQRISRSRFVTDYFAAAISKWQYTYNDDSVRCLFRQEATIERDSFPLLAAVVNNPCIAHGTLMADLWRYLVLWRYRGIYVGIDAIHRQGKFHPSTSISPETEAYLVVE